MRGIIRFFFQLVGLLSSLAESWVKEFRKRGAVGRLLLIAVTLFLCLVCACPVLLSIPSEPEVLEPAQLAAITSTPQPETSTSTPIPTSTPGSTATPEPTNRPSPTDTPEPTPTSEPPTVTPVPTATPTVTPVPTDTPIPLPTDTPLPIPTDTPAPTATASAAITIITVDKRAEYTDIRNTSGSPIDLAGWRLFSVRGDQDCPLGGVIQPDETLRIWAMSEDAGQGGYNCQFGTNIWNNSESDPAIIYDPGGVEISRYP